MAKPSNWLGDTPSTKQRSRRQTYTNSQQRDAPKDASNGDGRCFLGQSLQVGTHVAGRVLGNERQVHVPPQPQLGAEHPQDLQAGGFGGYSQGDLPVKAAGSPEGGVQCIRPVGGACAVNAW